MAEFSLKTPFVQISIVVDGMIREIFFFEKNYWMEALPGEEVALNIKNIFHTPIEVLGFFNGKNVLDSTKEVDLHSDECMRIASGVEWSIADFDQGSKFVIGDLTDPARTDYMDTICIGVFRQFVPIPIIARTMYPASRMMVDFDPRIFMRDPKGPDGLYSVRIRPKKWLKNLGIPELR